MNLPKYFLLGYNNLEDTTELVGVPFWVGIAIAAVIVLSFLFAIIGIAKAAKAKKMCKKLQQKVDANAVEIEQLKARAIMPNRPPMPPQGRPPMPPYGRW